MKLLLKVITNAKTNKIELNEDRNKLENYKVYLTTTPVKGEANKELIKLLAKHFQVSKSNITILKGEASHYKVIEIDNNE